MNKEQCPKCSLMFGKNVIARHVEKCEGIKTCPICGNGFTGKSKTCSYACSNTLFRSGKNNPNWKDDRYRTTCFLHHKKECIICGEKNIVSVHHLNENRNDNRPENLIPLCPTHHQYVHSRYKDEVVSKIDEYLEIWWKQGVG